jgi:hypothetical protein
LDIYAGGHMVAAMALMESPAIIVGVLLIRMFKTESKRAKKPLAGLLQEAFTNGSVVMILGSLLVGYFSDPVKAEEVMPFTELIFKGMLTFFLLDMGLLAGKRIQSLKKAGLFLTAFALLLPIVNALFTIGICHALEIGVGNSLLLTILAASASYIAVPAAMRMAVPEANPGLYVPMSLAITFPFNIIIGIPAYLNLIQILRT